MLSVVATVAAMLAAQVAAYPHDWYLKAGAYSSNQCILPPEGTYRSHPSVVSQAPGITFTLKDSTGAPVTTFTPNTNYTISVSYTTSAAFYLIVSSGTLSQDMSTAIAGLTYAGANCQGGSTPPYTVQFVDPQGKTPVVTTFSAIWQAPAYCYPVVFSVSLGTGETNDLMQNTMTATATPGAAGCSSTPAGVPPPASATPSPSTTPSPSASPSPAPKTSSAPGSLVAGALMAVLALVAALL